jgi:putative endonuclease
MYITASKHWTLYTGVTSALGDRTWKHKTKAFVGFASKYNCDRLGYFEEFGDVTDAIAREKQVKGWTRAKKLALIQATNPELRDLAADWFPADAIEAVRELNLKTQEEIKAQRKTRHSERKPSLGEGCSRRTSDPTGPR